MPTQIVFLIDNKSNQDENSFYNQFISDCEDLQLTPKINYTSKIIEAIKPIYADMTTAQTLAVIIQEKLQHKGYTVSRTHYVMGNIDMCAIL